MHVFRGRRRDFFPIQSKLRSYGSTNHAQIMIVLALVSSRSLWTDEISSITMINNVRSTYSEVTGY